MNDDSSINTFDLYGVKPKLNLNGRETRGSVLGLISTVISITLMVVSSIYFSIDLFDKTDVSILTSSIKTDELLNTTLDKNSFFFAVGLEDPNTYDTFLDEGIYKAQAFYKVANRDENGELHWSVQKLNLTKCSKDYLGDEYANKVITTPLETMYCIPNINASIFGTYLLETYSMIFITIEECKNTTENIHCKSQEEIDYYLDGTFIMVEYQDYTFDPKNHKKPNKPIMKHFYTSISHNFFKELQLFFKIITIKTDNGILFESIEEKNYTQYDNSVDLLSYKKSDYMSEISIKLSDYVDEMNRSYEKVQAVIANIGGIIKFIHSFFFVFNLLFNHTTLNTILIKQLFFLKSYKDSDISIHYSIANTQSKQIIQPYKTTSVNFFPSYCSPYKQNTNQIEQKANIKFKKSQKLKMSFFLGLAICFKARQNNSNIKYYLRGTNLINHKLNIASMISESYCNELLYSLLLNDNQQKLLQFSSKPEISLNDQKMILKAETLHYYQHNQINEVSVKKEKKEKEEVINAYLNMKLSNLTSIDKVLLNKTENLFT